MRNVSVKLAASLLVAAAVAGPAAAQDKKNYPGVACLAPGAEITKIDRTSNGRAMNMGPGDTAFVCPAVRDYSSIAGATVFVLDSRPDRQVSCTLHFGRPESIATYFLSDGSGVAHYSSDSRQLDFGAISGSGSSYGFYTLDCTVPGPSDTGARSGVVSYQINENE